jgi:hypothetical protein
VHPLAPIHPVYTCLLPPVGVEFQQTCICWAFVFALCGVPRAVVAVVFEPNLGVLVALIFKCMASVRIKAWGNLRPSTSLSQMHKCFLDL